MSSIDDRLTRVQFYIDAVRFEPPRYRVTRTLTGRWPWRRWEYRAESPYSIMTMSEEAYAFFKAQFRTQIDE